MPASDSWPATKGQIFKAEELYSDALGMLGSDPSALRCSLLLKRAQVSETPFRDAFGQVLLQKWQYKVGPMLFDALRTWWLGRLGRLPGSFGFLRRRAARWLALAGGGGA